MLGVPGIAARTFAALYQQGTSVSLISQSSSEQSICFSVPEASAKRARERSRGVSRGDRAPRDRRRRDRGRAVDPGASRHHLGSPAREGGRSMDMSAQPTARTSPGTRRRAPVRWAEVRRRTPTVSPSLSHRLNVLALVLTALIVVTGAAVRLTGSGLGCADWPECSVGHLTPALQFHGLVEFGNRLVTVVLTVAVIAAALLGWVSRSPRRRDLIWLSGGLVAGVVAQAVLGGIVVYTKLNPYLVMVHSSPPCCCGGRGRPGPPLHPRLQPGIGPSPGAPATAAPLLRRLAPRRRRRRGHGHHRRGPPRRRTSGQQAAKRLPIALRDMAELHSSLALLLIGVTIGLVVALHMVDVPERSAARARILLVVLVAQAAVGYTQYFTHLPALLVEVHILGGHRAR